jgi:hypothetical protein
LNSDKACLILNHYNNNKTYISPFKAAAGAGSLAVCPSQQPDLALSESGIDYEGTGCYWHPGPGSLQAPWAGRGQTSGEGLTAVACMRCECLVPVNRLPHVAGPNPIPPALLTSDSCCPLALAPSTTTTTTSLVVHLNIVDALKLWSCCADHSRGWAPAGWQTCPGPPRLQPGSLRQARAQSS